MGGRGLTDRRQEGGEERKKIWFESETAHLKNWWWMEKSETCNFNERRNRAIWNFCETYLYWSVFITYVEMSRPSLTSHWPVWIFHNILSIWHLPFLLLQGHNCSLYSSTIYRGSPFCSINGVIFFGNFLITYRVRHLLNSDNKPSRLYTAFYFKVCDSFLLLQEHKFWVYLLAYISNLVLDFCSEEDKDLRDFEFQ